MTTVLVVDAPRSVRKALCGRLSLEDGLVIVGEAGDATGAMRQTRILDPDVVLIDAEAAELDACALAHALVERGHGAVVVVLTEHVISLRLSLARTPTLVVGKSEGLPALVRAIRSTGVRSHRV